MRYQHFFHGAFKQRMPAMSHWYGNLGLMLFINMAYRSSMSTGRCQIHCIRGIRLTKLLRSTSFGNERFKPRHGMISLQSLIKPGRH